MCSLCVRDPPEKEASGGQERWVWEKLPKSHYPLNNYPIHHLIIHLIIHCGAFKSYFKQISSPHLAYFNAFYIKVMKQGYKGNLHLPILIQCAIMQNGRW